LSKASGSSEGLKTILLSAEELRNVSVCDANDDCLVCAIDFGAQASAVNAFISDRSTIIFSADENIVVTAKVKANIQQNSGIQFDSSSCEECSRFKQ